MNKLSIPTKKNFLIFFNKLSEFLSKTLSKLNIKNLKQLAIDLIYDRRFVITIGIIILSIFAHLSTPAFYQDKWVLTKIKKQLENEFNITFLLPEKVSYSMFPVPSFYLNDVKLTKDGRKIGKIDYMKLCLSYNKFFDKEKVNIQDIHISNSSFDLYKEELNNLISFYDKKINEKPLIIKESKIFLRDQNQEIFSLINLDSTRSFFDQNNEINKLNIEGEIYNNEFNLSLENDYKIKQSIFDLNLNKIGRRIQGNIDYSKKKNSGEIIYSTGSKNNITEIDFNNDYLEFNSKDKIYGKPLFNGLIGFKPFFSNINVNLDKLNFKDLLDNDALFFQLISSNIFDNQNLNYEVKVNSKKIDNHRKLNDLNFIISYGLGKLSFDNSTLIFDDQIPIKINNSIFVSNEKERYFLGGLLLEINERDNLFKFFQTRKENRHKIKNIYLSFKYDFNNQKVKYDKLLIDGKSNDKIKNLLKSYNKKNVLLINRIEIRKFFNSALSTL